MVLLARDGSSLADFLQAELERWMSASHFLADVFAALLADWLQTKPEWSAPSLLWNPVSLLHASVWLSTESDFLCFAGAHVAACKCTEESASVWRCFSALSTALPSPLIYIIIIAEPAQTTPKPPDREGGGIMKGLICRCKGRITLKKLRKGAHRDKVGGEWRLQKGCQNIEGKFMSSGEAFLRFEAALHNRKGKSEHLYG